MLTRHIAEEIRYNTQNITNHILLTIFSKKTYTSNNSVSKFKNLARAKPCKILGINFITVNRSHFSFFLFGKHCIFSASQSGRLDLKYMTKKKKNDFFS